MDPKLAALIAIANAAFNSAQTAFQLIVDHASGKTHTADDLNSISQQIQSQSDQIQALRNMK
jgi:hypothetical protein